MKIPRNVSGRDLAKKLSKYEYQITRQLGSHIRLTTTLNGVHHITIPDHNTIKIGTLSAILRDVSSHFRITKEELVVKLF